MITHHIENQICIIRINTNIAPDTIDATQSYISPLASDPQVKAILLDLSNVKYIDSSGMAMIVGLYKQTHGHLIGQSSKEKGAMGFGVFSIGERTSEIFKLSSLEKIIDIFPDESAACEAMTDALLV